MNAKWHEGKIVGLIEESQNNWSDSEICEIWTQKNCPIPVILWFAFLHVSPLKIIYINIVTHELSIRCCFFTVVNNPLESQFDITCVDKLLSTVNSVLINSGMSANDISVTNF